MFVNNHARVRQVHVLGGVVRTEWEIGDSAGAADGLVVGVLRAGRRTGD